MWGLKVEFFYVGLEGGIARINGISSINGIARTFT